MADMQETSRRAFGPVAAVFIAAGVGAVILGILTALAEASESAKDALELNARVGSLSGKTIGAVAVFLIVWLVLHLAWKEKDLRPGKVFTWTWIMLAIGVALTFPIVFQAFG